MALGKPMMVIYLCHQ